MPGCPPGCGRWTGARPSRGAAGPADDRWSGEGCCQALRLSPSRPGREAPAWARPRASPGSRGARASDGQDAQRSGRANSCASQRARCQPQSASNGKGATWGSPTDLPRPADEAHGQERPLASSEARAWLRHVLVVAEPVLLERGLEDLVLDLVRDGQPGRRRPRAESRCRGLGDERSGSRARRPAGEGRRGSAVGVSVTSPFETGAQI